MTTLVTGATGFIGARLVDALLERGDNVRILARETSDCRALIAKDIMIFRGALDNRDDVINAMFGCDRVYHLAAFAKNWALDEKEARRINIDAVRTIFNAALECGVERVVYTSTILTYGPSNGAAVSEDTIREIPPQSLYDQSKIDAEEEVTAALERGLDVVTVHPTRVYGPGKLTEANSTTILIKQYLRGTWRTIPGAGDAAGNYVYVDDVVRGCIAAMERGTKGRHYILGGDNLTYSEFFDLIAAATGKRRSLLPIPKPLAKAFSYVELAFGRLGFREPAITPAWVDIFYDDWMASIARARKELGYEPTPVHRALEETVAWIRRGCPEEVSS